MELCCLLSLPVVVALIGAVVILVVFYWFCAETKKQVTDFPKKNFQPVNVSRCSLLS